MDQKTHEWLKRHTVAKHILPLQWRQEIEYLVIHADIEGLPYFAGYPDGEILFVSESVPPEYVRYVLLHEIEEWDSHKLRGKCLKASESEAIFYEGDHSNANDRLQYWRFRVEFFRNLIAYEERTNPESERIEGFKLSLAFFEGKQSRDWPT